MAQGRDRLVLLGGSLALVVALIVRMDGTGLADHRAAPAPTVRADPRAGGCPALAGDAVRVAPGAGKTVALTFDDGPGPWTAGALAVLHRAHVPATFFVIGRQAAANPALIRRIAAEGHLVGNHTWSHRPPSGGRAWSASYLAGELARTDRTLHGIIGVGTCWFRPPDGVMTGAEPVARSRGLRIALWSVDPQDWRLQAGVRADRSGRLSATIAARAEAGGRQQHPVILLHDGGGYRGATVAALPSIIDYYRLHGYRFVRLDGR